MTVDRIWELVDASGDCWEWTGRLVRGYGTYADLRAHRLIYELLVGPIPDGLTIDHLCRNRACVNPTHLEAVSIRVNALRGFAPPAMNARKTACPRGHSNWHVSPSRPMKRRCRDCERDYNALRPKRHLDASGEPYRNRSRLSRESDSPV